MEQAVTNAIPCLANIIQSNHRAAQPFRPSGLAENGHSVHPVLALMMGMRARLMMEQRVMSIFLALRS